MKYKFLKRMQELVVNTVLPRDAKKSDEEIAKERARDSLMLGQVTISHGILLSEEKEHTLHSSAIADLMYDAYYAGHLIGEFSVTMTDKEFAEIENALD